jgi:hypothetical protein
MYQLGYEDDAETFNLKASTNLAAEVGIRTQKLPADIHVYPNPANHFVTISVTPKNRSAITIYNAQGIEKFKSEKDKQIHTVDISEYPSGIYFVKVADGNSSYLHRIVKN